MKKVLAIVLTAIMVVSMFAVCASAAPEGTAIKSAADFAAMTAEGKYYLANDITLDATYTTPFKGTLDGNGKKITTSVPIFSELDGATIKNLTTAGDVTVADTNQGLIACAVTKTEAGDTVFENVTNNGNLTSSTTVAGLFVGRIYGVESAPSSLTFRNCVNNGNIESTSHTAPFVAYKDDTSKKQAFVLTMTDCVNNGNATIASTGGAGGVAGFLGSIASGDNNAATGAVTTLTNCVNNGTITGTVDKPANAYSGVAGLIGAISGVCEIKNCKNAGAVSGGKGNTAGLIGSLRNATLNATIENCDSVGAITADEANTYVGMIFGRGDNAAGKATVKNCYYTGNIALNGKLTDGFTLTPDGTPANASVYKAPETTAETTTAAGGETTTDKKETDSTGDTSMIIALTVVGIVAFIGTTAVVMRKKEN